MEREAAIRAHKAEERRKADNAAKLDKEWDRKMSEGLVAIVDVAAGKGDLKEAASKFPLKPDCKKDDTDSVTCVWSDLTDALGDYDGTGLRTS